MHRSPAPADQLSFNPLAVASAGHGAWQMTGQRTFNLTYLNLTFDAFSSGNPTGTLKVRQTTRMDRVDTLTPAQATTPTTIWTAIPFPASVEPLPSRPSGLWCRPLSSPRGTLTNHCGQPIMAARFCCISLDNFVEWIAKFRLDTDRISTTIWLWIGWVQHLRLCLIPPVGR